ncbi:MAG: hypothetical protein KatS3mg111_2708 [Pirellulaceae bacterium]|nr:MAG: hypothetical protein KatS3mg111_2708 [Pirellulaceae bacterium]
MCSTASSFDRAAVASASSAKYTLQRINVGGGEEFGPDRMVILPRADVIWRLDMQVFVAGRVAESLRGVGGVWQVLVFWSICSGLTTA